MNALNFGHVHGPPAQNHSGNGHATGANDAFLRVTFTQAHIDGITATA